MELAPARPSKENDGLFRYTDLPTCHQEGLHANKWIWIYGDGWEEEEPCARKEPFEWIIDIINILLTKHNPTSSSWITQNWNLFPLPSSSSSYAFVLSCSSLPISTHCTALIFYHRSHNRLTREIWVTSTLEFMHVRCRWALRNSFLITKYMLQEPQDIF
jgi:hypothetical protein